jgi:hypothetical protein
MRVERFGEASAALPHTFNTPAGSQKFPFFPPVFAYQLFKVERGLIRILLGIF